MKSFGTIVILIEAKWNVQNSLKIQDFDIKENWILHFFKDKCKTAFEAAMVFIMIGQNEHQTF